ncbi:MAG: beta strand repeat-containing protein [Verrucomicrobiota bacterium]
MKTIAITFPRGNSTKVMLSRISHLAIAPAVLALWLLTPASASAQLYTTTSGTDGWYSARWATTSGGPYTSAWVPGSDTSFVTSGTYTFGSMWATSATPPVTTGTIGNITTGSNVFIRFTNNTSQQMGFGGAIKTFDVGAGSEVDFGGIALLGTGGNGLIKNGTGTLTLSGGNYQGGLTINAGNMVARTNNGFGTGALNINGGAIGSTLNYNSPVARINGINIGGDFQIGISGSTGSASSTANMTFSGTGSAVNLGGATRKITLGSSGSMTFSGVISNGGLTLSRNADGAAGSFSLSGTNTFASGLVIDGVAVNAMTVNSTLGAGAVTLGGATGFNSTLNLRSALTIANDITIANTAGGKTITNSVANATISGTITYNDSTGGLLIGSTTGRVFTLANGIAGNGTSNLTIGGTSAGVALSGQVTINGESTYAGDTIVNSAKVNLGANNALAQNDLTLSGTATLDLNGFSQTVKELAGDSTSKVQSTGSLGTLLVGAGNSTSTYAGQIISAGGNVALEKVGTGTLRLTGTNTYSGGTIVSAGSLIGTTSSLQGNITNNSAVTFDQSTSGTYSQVMSGTGSLTKSGNGALIISGSNTYAGATVVDSGELNVNGSIASSAVTVNSGGSLSGSGTVGGISGAGSINPGNSPGILTAPWIDPSDGMFLNFEITGIKPAYSQASNSVNDVLHLTSASPITAAMTSANQINVYFNMASFDMTQAYLGGIYTDDQADFTNLVSNATLNYYVQDNAGTINYNGVLYSALSSAVTVSTVLDTANFAGGTVNGRVMQFTIVPELSSALLSLIAGGVAIFRRRRQPRA